MAKPKKDEDEMNSYLDGGPGLPNDQVIEDIFTAKQTLHADDAVDYEDIDELADEAELAALTPAAPDADEARRQHDADVEFDDVFGDDDDMGTDRLMDGGLDGELLHDGLGDIDLDDIYGSPAAEAAPAEAAPKRRIQSEEDRQRKKQKVQQLVAHLERRQMKRNLRYHYPQFRSDKPFNNHNLFQPPPLFFKFNVPPIAYKPKPLIPTKLSLNIDVDQRKIFKSGKHPVRYSAALPGVTGITDDDVSLAERIAETGLEVKQLVPLAYLTKDGSNDDKLRSYSKDLILAAADWDDEAILNAGDNDSKKRITFEENGISLDFKQGDDDDDEYIFDGRLTKDKIKLDMNDPNLLFERSQPKPAAIENKLKSRALIPLSDKLMKRKFNISNDKQYEVLTNNYNTKVRNQIGNLNIEHSIPALRLQSPYYKVRLSKEDSRSLHRSKFLVRPGTLVSFSKIKTRKKKKDKGKTPQEIFHKTSELTATDNATLIGMEYSEEYPIILSNFGMGSKLINYYRKEREDDNARPKAPVGETHVLGVEDRSPFWNLGYVAKGDFVPTLYNNMIRAPIFQHDPSQTDFLLIRSQGCGNHQRYYLRNLNHTFAVGQTFPSVEVPAPHSRKVTNTSKNRLKMIVFRTMNKKGEARISVKDISKHFPDQNDMQNRQRLKEFMEYQRHGEEDKGFWKIRGQDTVPSEENIRRMITPEDVSLLDSMQAHQQLLDDLMLLVNDEHQQKVKKEKEKAEKAAQEAEKENNEEKTEQEKKEEKKAKKEERKRERKEVDPEDGIDEQLASWNLTRNFIISNQTKSMLQLNGEGDPTGIGIGFSFLRTTQKIPFSPLFPPPKENVPKSNQAAYQQRLYEEECSRIWYSQRRALTVDSNESDHNLKNVYSEYHPMSHHEALRKKYVESTIELTKQFKNKALKISRRFRDENGIVQRKTEVIKDPRLIKAYIRRKKQIEDDLLKEVDLDEIVPTNDKELNKIRRKALEEKLANLERRAKHSKGRKPAKDPLHLAAAVGGRIIDANTVMLPDGSYAIGGKGIGKGKSRTRRCAACGAFGHIRTKKSCPLYNQTQGGTIDIGKAGSPVQPGSQPSSQSPVQSVSAPSEPAA